MQADFAPSPQQWAAITAPLSPAVVIAGAGSGKTTLMAARVVYLVVTGQVRPDQILGLTFTTKAAGELRTRIRAALVTAGVLDAAPRDGEEDVLEPTVATYNAYAANLLTEHGLRIGHEPDTRVVTDAARYQLGARVVDRYTGVVQHLTDHPETAIQNLLALDSTMSEHLRSPDEVPRVRRRRAAGVPRRAAGGGAGQAPRDVPRRDRQGDLRHRPPRRAARARRELPPAQGRPRAHGLLRPDRPRAPGWPTSSPTSAPPSATSSGWCCSTSTRTPRSPRPSCSPGCSPGPTRRPGSATPSPRWATPTRRSTAGGAPRCPTSSTSPRPSPPPRGDVPVLPLTVNRRSDARILDLANVLAAPLYDAFPQVSPLVAKDGAAARSRADPGLRDPPRGAGRPGRAGP